MAEKQNNDPIQGNVSKQGDLKQLVSGRSLMTKLCIILVVISCIVYTNTLYNGYVLDDSMMIGENTFVVKGMKGISQLLTTPHLEGYTHTQKDTYRPLSLVMFAIEYQFFGPNTVTGHLFNVVVFAACVLMLFLFLNNLFDGERMALTFIAALLFAVHPIHTEVVANIKSRDELLCFFFSFLSLNIFINYAREGKLAQLISGALCLFLSVLSKETSVTFIVIIPLIFFFYRNENRKRSVIITLSTVVTLALFVIIRTIIINKYRSGEDPALTILDNFLIGAPSTASYIATAMLILGNYLKLLFIPYPLISDHSYNSVPYAELGNVWVLASVISYLSLAGIGIYRLFKNKKDPWALGILFFLATILLFCNVPYGPFLTIGTEAERWTFFASAGICLLIALAFEQWIFRSSELNVLKSGKAMILFTLCLVYSAVAISRNTDWKDDHTLYKADVERSPNNTRLNAFLGAELLKKYEDEPDAEKKVQINYDCIKYLKKALAIYPDNASAHADLGSAFLISKDLDSSILHFESALRIDPKNITAITNLGTLYSLTEQYAASVPYYRKTLSMEPGDTVTWFNLAISYLHIEQYDSAISAFKRTILLNPGYNRYAAYPNIAAVYYKIGNMDSAQKYEAVTRQYYPTFSLEASRLK